MKTKVTSSIKITLTTPICIKQLAYCANAQTKEIQTTNLAAPEGLKIDGNLQRMGLRFSGLQ